MTLDSMTKSSAGKLLESLTRGELLQRANVMMLGQIFQNSVEAAQDTRIWNSVRLMNNGNSYELFLPDVQLLLWLLSNVNLKPWLNFKPG